VDNAYKPPDAPVADPPLPAVKVARRPWPISLASILILAAIIDAGARLGRGNQLDLGVGMFWIGALVFLALMIERRRNWARWVLVAVAAWNLLKLILAVAAPSVPAGVHLMIDYGAVAREAAATLCLVAAVVLVFVPGRAWFERGNS